MTLSLRDSRDINVQKVAACKYNLLQENANLTTAARKKAEVYEHTVPADCRNIDRADCLRVRQQQLDRASIATTAASATTTRTQQRARRLRGRHGG